MQRVISYWLIPCPEHKAKFQQIISDLSEKYDAPVFEPHLTVFTGIFSDDEAKNVLRTTLPGTGALVVKADKLDYTAEYTKTFILRMVKNEYIEQLYMKMRSMCREPSSFVFEPHMSFIYKLMPKETKRQFMDSISIPVREVTFDSVKAIDTPEPVETREHVESWRIVSTMPLS